MQIEVSGVNYPAKLSFIYSGLYVKFHILQKGNSDIILPLYYQKTSCLCFFLNYRIGFVLFLSGIVACLFRGSDFLIFGWLTVGTEVILRLLY